MDSLVGIWVLGFCVTLFAVSQAMDYWGERKREQAVLAGTRPLAAGEISGLDEDLADLGLSLRAVLVSHPDSVPVRYLAQRRAVVLAESVLASAPAKTLRAAMMLTYPRWRTRRKPTHLWPALALGAVVALALILYSPLIDPTLGVLMPSILLGTGLLLLLFIPREHAEEVALVQTGSPLAVASALGLIHHGSMSDERVLRKQLERWMDRLEALAAKHRIPMDCERDAVIESLVAQIVPESFGSLA